MLLVLIEEGKWCLQAAAVVAYKQAGILEACPQWQMTFPARLLLLLPLLWLMAAS
jgi:hypothetical protein